MLDNKKSLDYQKFFIQQMEDILLSHIRYTKKEIEREIKIIFLQLKKYLSECTSKSEFKEKTSSLSNQIKTLKEKLNKLKKEEGQMIIELRNRLNKTLDCLDHKESSNCSFLKFKEYNEYQNNILLGAYFLDKGLIETFFCFQKENNLSIYEYNFFAEKQLLINYINEEKTKKILEWVKFYKKKIIQNNSTIILNLLSNLFYIYKNEQINELNCNVNCINFIRKYFGDLMNVNRGEITKLIMSLIVNKNKENENENENKDNINNRINNDSKKLISNIKEIINEKYKELFGLGIYSLFELLITLGITTLRTNICDSEPISKEDKKEKDEKKEKEGINEKDEKEKSDKKNNVNCSYKNNDCPICGENGCHISKINNKIFNYIHNRSYLFFSITGKLTNASNPPIINEETYMDPKTKKEYNISECKLLYLS